MSGVGSVQVSHFAISFESVRDKDTLIFYCIEMPKTKENRQGFLRRVTEKYPKVFRADNSVLFCLVCDTTVNADQIFLVNQHLGTSNHKRKAEEKKCRNGKDEPKSSHPVSTRRNINFNETQ